MVLATEEEITKQKRGNFLDSNITLNAWLQETTENLGVERTFSLVVYCSTEHKFEFVWVAENMSCLADDSVNYVDEACY